MGPQNPGIIAIPDKQYQKKEKTSQYKGVAWNRDRKKWYVLMYLKGEKLKYGGTFCDELDAAKRVNQICEELGIPQQNPTISAIPNEQYQKKEKTSQHKGVSWSREKRKWRVQLSSKGEKLKCGYFIDEMDAANKVNQLCEELGMSLENPEISVISNQQYQHGEHQIIQNPVIRSEILKTDNDDAEKKEEKREKEFNDDQKLPDETHYFYDHMLK